MEPLVSLPSEKCTSPAATAAADPPEEPPAIRERSCGVTRRPVMAVFGGKPVGVGIHIQHPGEQRARAVQLAHRPAIGNGGGAIAQQLRPGKGRVSGDIEKIFHRIGNACQRGQRLFFPPQGIDIFRLSEHAFFADVGPGVDLRVNPRDVLQGVAGDLFGAEFAAGQRALDVVNRHFRQLHAL
ncbi:Uncharacterised protein [Klebsiella grimontii]|uniref:Uncharacterized protein n=1 Tax=Klebsiella grimontii TaxID=2058152 RepID=A0A7H4P6H6_9ENTR|nr:Uncharacterised protein [Klebsiella grimontii]